MTDGKKRKLKASIIDEMGEKPGPALEEHIDAYLRTLEAAEEMNDRARELLDDPKRFNLYLKYGAEARRQEKAAREILLFLGISGDKKTDNRKKPIMPL